MRMLLGVMLLVASGTAAAADAPPPRFEFGVGGLAMGLPDYRGSDRYSLRVLPIPYAVYRSEHVQLTREGLRARLFSVERLSASLSAAINLTGHRGNPERAAAPAMPDLAPTLEAGPSLDWLLSEPGQPLHLKLRLPVRAVAAVDGLEFRDVGVVAVPHLRADFSERRGAYEWSYLGSVGPVWASEDYHEYFYGVASQYANATRPAYDAKAGYSGARASVSGAVGRGRWHLGAFVSCDWLKGAVFEDSPLVRSDTALQGGIYVAYRLYASGVGEPLEGEGEGEAR